jgi:hypothetical protein
MFACRLTLETARCARPVQPRPPRLLQREVHGDRQDDGNRHALEQRRREDPLAHGVEGSLIEQRNRTQDARVTHLAVGPDRGRATP